MMILYIMWMGILLAMTVVLDPIANVLFYPFAVKFPQNSIKQSERHARLDFCLWQPEAEWMNEWIMKLFSSKWAELNYKIIIDDEKESKNG